MLARLKDELGMADICRLDYHAHTTRSILYNHGNIQLMLTGTFNAQSIRQVYTIAAYVEADKCAKELGIRSRGGFFGESCICQALSQASKQEQ